MPLTVVHVIFWFVASADTVSPFSGPLTSNCAPTLNNPGFGFTPLTAYTFVGSPAFSILIRALFVTVLGIAHSIVDDPLLPPCALLLTGKIGVHWSPSKSFKS